MKIIETFKNIDLIQIDADHYCVRKRYKSFFGKDKVTFFDLTRNGTHFTHDGLSATITIDGPNRARYVFNANAIKLGKV